MSVDGLIFGFLTIYGYLRISMVFLCRVSDTKVMEIELIVGAWWFHTLVVFNHRNGMMVSVDEHILQGG